MIRVEVVASPKLLEPSHLAGRTVVVLDVLRATTTMVAALHAGCREIRVFAELEEARSAAWAFDGPRLLCGERRAQPPAGFDLGNSPGDFTPQRCAGRTLFMTTTNGTVALLASVDAEEVVVGAVCNAAAVARHVKRNGRDVTLLCAGQRMDVAMEDLFGCGAVMDRMASIGCELDLFNDASVIARELFAVHQSDLASAFRRCRGARTELITGLSADIDYCAVADRFDLLGRWEPSARAVRASVP